MELWDAYDSNFNIIPGETLMAMKGELLTHRMWQFVPELQD